MALNKLSFRDDTEARADTWSPTSDVVTQDRSTRPTLEQHQKSLNRAKPTPSNSGTTPPPGVVVEEKKMSGGRVMKTLKDQAGKLFKQIFDGSNVVYDSRGMATASLARKDRKILLAMIVSKASKEEWIQAQEKVMQRLMNEKGWDWDTAYDYTSKNTQLIDDQLSDMYPEDDPRIER